MQRVQHVQRQPRAAAARPARPAAAGLLRLQRQAGNRAVAGLVQRTEIEPAAVFDQPGWATVLAGGRLLRAGCPDHPLVAGLQTALGRCGYDPGVVDGLWGRHTSDAVVSFQQAKELTPDAIVGPQTAGALQAALGAATTPVKTEGSDGVATITTALGVTPASDPQSVLRRLSTMVGMPASLADLVPIIPPPTLGLAQDLLDDLAPPAVQRLAIVQCKHRDTNVAATPGVQLSPEQIQGMTVLLDALIASFTLALATGQTNGIPATEVKASLARLQLMRGLSDERHTAAVGGAVVDNRAFTAVALAQSMVGRADSTKSDGLDPADSRGRSFRMSRDVLMQFFDVAFGGVRAPEGSTAKERAHDPFWYDADIVNHITKGTKLVPKKDANGVVQVDPETKKPLTERKDVNDTLLDWCGIFPLWAVRSAGFAVGTWSTGKTVSAAGGFRRLDIGTKEKPGQDTLRPGDVGEVGNALQHQILVVNVQADGDSLDTVEGNTDGGGGAQGGQVAQHSGRRAISTTKAGFYRPADSL